tara:strand:+ start:369 stop:587 length:219 start_codon:yes stop_codon:yes gene_type:complete
MKTNTTTPYKKGQKCVIYNGCHKTGVPIVEGKATLLSPVKGRGSATNYWNVQFDEEPGEIYRRYIHAEHLES